VKLDDQTLAMLDGMIAGWANGRADRGLDLEPLSRAQAVRRLLEDRNSSGREAVAILELATAG
jgi:hypothetical protein